MLGVKQLLEECDRHSLLTAQLRPDHLAVEAIEYMAVVGLGTDAMKAV